MFSTITQMAWVDGEFVRVANSEFRISEDESDSDLDNSRGSALFDADRTISFIPPVVTQHKRLSKFEKAQQKKLEAYMEERAAGQQLLGQVALASTPILESAKSVVKVVARTQDTPSRNYPPGSTVLTSTTPLEIAVSAAVEDHKNDVTIEDVTVEDGFSPFPSLRHRSQSTFQPIQPLAQTDVRTLWQPDDEDGGSKKSTTIYSILQEVTPKPPQAMSYSDILKYSPAAKVAIASPSKMVLLGRIRDSPSVPVNATQTNLSKSKTMAAGPSAWKPVAAETSLSTQTLLQTKDTDATHDVLASNPGKLTATPSVTNSTPALTTSVKKPRHILSLESWRAQPDNTYTAILNVVSAASRVAPLSFANVVSSPTAVMALARRPSSSLTIAAVLPQHSAEAQHVADEMSRYRRDHGLSEESRFTRMVKVEAKQTGVPRPQPIINNSIPAAESTAVYVRGLPASTTYYDLLENIHCGKIWHTYIDPPNPAKRQYASAAKVSFLTRFQAEAFMDDIECGRYLVRGQRVFNCTWDRRYEKERSNIAESRCIQIQGPAIYMQWGWFEREFSAKMDLKITDFFEVECEEPGRKIFQINFAGIFAQSRAVMKALETDFEDIYHFYYVPDPCNNNEY